MSLHHVPVPSEAAINNDASQTIEIFDNDDESREGNGSLRQNYLKKECPGELATILSGHQTLHELTEPPIKRSKLDDEDYPRINPFSKFAHQNESTSSKPDTSQLLVSAYKVKTKKSFSADKKLNKQKKCKEKVTRMDSLTPEEVDKVKAKWYGFLQQDDSIEDQRFQLLVAARLHARCQDKAVHHAMMELRKALRPLPFSARNIAKADPSVLQESIGNLLFYSVKSKQIVQAANEIVSRFDSQVPESESSLMTITGIGPVFADLLATINTRAAHRQRSDGRH